jgi:hypothetical protein
MNHPDTAQLAKAAYERSGAQTHEEFVAFMRNSISVRTVRRWLSGDIPATGLAHLVLREIGNGWIPGSVPDGRKTLVFKSTRA